MERSELRRQELGKFGDEFLRSDSIEIDGQLRLGSGTFHCQDGPIAELIVADALAALELGTNFRFGGRRLDRRRIKLNRRILEKRKHGVR